jgi:hypothetical protein
MKRIALVLALIFTLLTLTVAVQKVKSQYTPEGQAFILVSPINITSPANRTYATQPLTLNLTFRSYLDSSEANITLAYSVDGKANTTIDTQSTPVPMGVQSYYLITGYAILPDMPEGSHSVTVYGRYEFPISNHNIGLDNRTVYFTVNDGNPPIISNLSLENKTYNPKDLPLNFKVDEPTSWIGYCLDGQPNSTVTENFAITELSSGSHRLTIYANDTAGNMGASETINFSIATPLPTALVATALIVSVAIGGSVMFVYFKKRKHRT